MHYSLFLKHIMEKHLTSCILKRSSFIHGAIIVFLVGCSFIGDGSGKGSDGTRSIIRMEKVIAGLKNPVHISNAADGSNRLFIVEQGGTIRIFARGALLETPFLDITDSVSCCGEQGLLGLAFPPDYLNKRYFYVNYTNTLGDTIISRFHLVSESPDHADADREEIILTIKQPFTNHNGGHIVFGPDGYLYIGMGDGGSGGDPLNNAQNPGTLLGKLLRIDVESSVSPYAIPPGNPFILDTSYRPEIWAMGLRNPWRFSFDRTEGNLFIADVGQDSYEEIDFQTLKGGGGKNYGWNNMEGTHCYKAEICNQADFVLPVVEYDHSLGCSVTGGMVYRGSLYSGLFGMYFYGDFCSGRVWGLRQSEGRWTSEQLIDTAFMITAFGEDETGTIYVTDYATGTIYRIVPSP